MDLETVLSELKQLKEDFAELKNKFESLLGRAMWGSAPNTVSTPWSNSQPINYVACTRCGSFIQVGSVHFCQTNTVQPIIYQTPQNTQAVSPS